MSRVVLVTGVSCRLAARVARELAADPTVDRVLGVDAVGPAGDLGDAEPVRVDIRSPAVATVMTSAAVDTVVHLAVAPPASGTGGRSSAKETNVIGTMQLLAACQRGAGVRRLVVGSSTAVYGAGPRDPALFTEETEPQGSPRSGFARDVTEVEGYVRGFARRRPDVDVTVLRLAPVVGPDVDTPLTRYLSMPVLPSVLGSDPRLQLLHADDAVAVLRHAVGGGRPGTYNVAGSGVLLLSQAARRAGRPTLPLPAPATSVTGPLLRRVGLVDASAEPLDVLGHSGAVDTTRLERELGYRPRYSTAEALDAFLDSRGRGALTAERVQRVERRLGDLLTGGRTSRG